MKTTINTIILLLGISMLGGCHSMHGTNGKKAYRPWSKTLTDSQRSQLRANRRAFKQKMRLFRKQIKIARMELADLTTRDNPDQAAIENKINQMAALHKQRMQAVTELRINARRILNPEQRRQFDAFIARRAEIGRCNRKRQGLR